MASDDARLVGSAVAGDKDALSALLRQHGPEVSRRLHLSSIWQGVLDPEDVMQVTYLEAFLRVSEIAARDSNGFRAWLTRIAQNNLRDAIRELERQKRPDARRRVQQRADGDSCSSVLAGIARVTWTASQKAAEKESAFAIEAALAQLPPSYAKVLRLHDLEGRTVPEVAAELGRSTGAVYMLRARALDRLRELLGSESRYFSDGA